MDSIISIKEEISNRLLCMACLCVGRNLQEITNQKIKNYYLEALKEIPLCTPPMTTPLVCWECMALLKKAVLFREQVKDSYRILQTYTSENLNECLLSDITRPPLLKIISYEATTIAPEEAKQPEPEDLEKPDIHHVSVKDEVKHEWDIGEEEICVSPDLQGLDPIAPDDSLPDVSSVLNIADTIYKFEAMLSDEMLCASESDDLVTKSNDRTVAECQDLDTATTSSEKINTVTSSDGIFVTEDERIKDRAKTRSGDANNKVLRMSSKNLNYYERSDDDGDFSATDSSDYVSNIDERPRKLKKLTIPVKKAKVNLISRLRQALSDTDIDKTKKTDNKLNNKQPNQTKNDFSSLQLNKETRRLSDESSSFVAQMPCAVSSDSLDGLISVPNQANTEDIAIPSPPEQTTTGKRNRNRQLFDETKRSPIDDGPMSDGSENDKKLDDDLETLIGTLEKTKKKKKKKNVESKVKKREKISKSLKVNKKIQKKDDKKILKIELTYDEMLVERRKESTRDGYVNAKYKCETCLITFNFLKSYETHVNTKHSPHLGKYCCPICKTIIPSVDSFTAHYKRHMRRYECSICQKRTMDIKVMQQHYFSTHEISLRQYKCPLCGKLSNSIDAHRYHKDSHKQRLQCTQCDKTFRHRAALMNHRLTLHELQNNFPCTLCDKVFRWKTSLNRHLEKHNTKVKDAALSAAYCSLCGISFSSLCSYRRHMKNSLKHVTPEQLKYICDHCNRRFADKTKIRDHIEEKHLHRTYNCHICLKPSKNRVGLDQHIRNVHKGRPNNKMCHHCGKGFPTKVQLESHIRTHTGERPYICEYCPTTFTQQSNLYKHNRQVHLNIKSKRYPICKKRKDANQTESAMEQNEPVEYPVAILHYSPERGFVM